jgi:Glycosyl hydrolase family 9
LASYLTHAKQLYSFATSAQGSYQDLTSECLAQHGVGRVAAMHVLGHRGLAPPACVYAPVGMCFPAIERALWLRNSCLPCLPALQLLYKSTGFIDELAWAAAWLYKATNTASYLADAKKYYSQVSDPAAALALLCLMHSASTVSYNASRAAHRHAIFSLPAPAQIALPGYSFETGEKGPGLNVLMGDIDPDNAADYQSNAKQFFDQYLGQTIPCVPQLLH